MMNDHGHFMRLAMEQAEHALREDELPVGAVVAKAGEILGIGRRSANGNTRLDHGEMMALREAFDRDHRAADEMTIYTTLEPCAMCFGAILNGRVRRVVYALEDPYGGATKFRLEHMPPRHREKFPEIVGGVLREEARDLFRTFFQTTGKDFWRDHTDNPLVQLCVK